MASGYGYNGGRSRCFAYWQEFSKCYAGADAPLECAPQASDYLECLHHDKEIARAKMIQAELIKKVQHQAKESGKATQLLKDGGAKAGVGLITSDKKEPQDDAK